MGIIGPVDQDIGPALISAVSWSTSGERQFSGKASVGEVVLGKMCQLTFVGEAVEETG